MSDVSEIKTHLVADLWLSQVREGGDVLYPKLKKNKKMKLFTLTNDGNFQEIIVFEENNLITRDRVIAWTHSHLKKLRLETELSPARVLGTTRYEDSISGPSFSVNRYFPFDIINLDFSCQNPDLERCRIEKEVESLERTIKLQIEQNNRGFVMIYTTLLNSNNLDYTSVVRTSNSIQAPGWAGLDVGDFSASIADHKEKIECLKSVVSKLFLKYNAQVHNDRLNTDHHRIGTTPKYVCSIAGLLRTG